MPRALHGVGMIITATLHLAPNVATQTQQAREMRQGCASLVEGFTQHHPLLAASVAALRCRTWPDRPRQALSMRIPLIESRSSGLNIYADT
jgi:hypothetical protein